MISIRPKRFWWMTAAVATALFGNGLCAAADDAPNVKQMTLDLGDGAALKLVLIPAGKFIMGSSDPEKKRFSPQAGADETLHEVTLTRPFYLGATHVTVDQFAAFVRKTGYTTDAEREGGGPTWRNPGIAQNGDHPVVTMSYNDARAFCDWLTKVHAKNCHLPGEAQWEYACRAGTSTAFAWGDDPADGKLSAHWNAPRAGTAPAGSLKPNPWGLYDMHGNALAWCSDCYGPYAKGPVTDPAGPAAPFPYDFSGGRTHVLRGGAWHLPPAQCRSAYRHWGAVDHRFSGLGFRVCVDVP